MRFIGRGRFEDLGTYGSLDDARAARDAAGRDHHTRPAMIYAHVAGRAGLHVE